MSDHPMTNDELQQRECELQKALEAAVYKADSIIINAANGNNEELNWLTGQLALKFVEKALRSFSSELMASRLGLSMKPGPKPKR